MLLLRSDRKWIVVFLLTISLAALHCTSDSNPGDDSDDQDGDCISCNEAKECLDFAQTHNIYMGLDGFPACVDGIMYTCTQPVDSPCCEGTGKVIVVSGSCMTDGDVADGDVADGDTTDGDVEDGDITDGDEIIPDGDADQETADGDVEDGDVSDGDVTDGDVTDGDIDGDQDMGEGEGADEDFDCSGLCQIEEFDYCLDEDTVCVCDEELGEWEPVNCSELCAPDNSSGCSSDAEEGDAICHCNPIGNH